MIQFITVQKARRDNSTGEGEMLINPAQITTVFKEFNGSYLITIALSDGEKIKLEFDDPGQRDEKFDEIAGRDQA